MSRDKQIDEIAKLICSYPQCIHYNVIGECKIAECQTADVAEQLYNAGYRRASEVAKEIFEEGRMKLCFGDIVVVDEIQIGVVVKCWGRSLQGNPPSYDVYVRSYNKIVNYPEDKVDRYMVRHKYLNEEEEEYQKNALKGV